MKEGIPNDIEGQVKMVEEFESEIFMALEFGPLEASAKEDLLARIDAKIEELQKNPEPLLSEGSVETIRVLREDVVEHPVRTTDDDMDDLYENTTYKKAA